MVQSFLFSLLVLITASQFQVNSYNVDAKASKVEWLGEKITGSHTGLINIKNGNLNLEDGVLKGGEFTMDMNSMSCTDLQGAYADKLIGHLKSDDFFGTSKYPTAKLVITKVTALKDGKYKVTSDVTIKGKTNPVSFETELKEKDGKVKATANIVIDRTKFDVRYGSSSFFDGLGDKTIYNDFKLTVSLVANKAVN